MDQSSDKRLSRISEQIQSFQHSIDVLKTNFEHLELEQRNSTFVQMKHAWTALGITVLAIAVAFASSKEFLAAGVMLVIGIAMIILCNKIALYQLNRKSNSIPYLNLLKSEFKQEDSKPQPIELTSMSRHRYGVYIKERDALINASQKESTDFDKYILTLASGTFGLSLLFINQIMPNPNKSNLPFLFCAWGAFCMSICLTLISFQVSIEAHKKQIKILEQVYFEENSSKRNEYAAWTTRLNWLSGAFFVTGVILLICFCIFNMIGD